jgi:hypothetical protein
MDPITLIVTALVAGASKVAGETATDAYHALVAALRRRFAKDDKAKLILDEHAKEAATAESSQQELVWDAPLRKCLTDEEADRDPQIIAAAKAVLTALGQGQQDGNIIQVIGGDVVVDRGGHMQAHDVGTAKMIWRG